MKTLIARLNGTRIVGARNAAHLVAIATLLMSAAVAKNARAQVGPLPKGTTSGYAEVNGTKLYYEMAGKGRTLVLIHGGAVDRRAWDDQFPEFSQHYRTIRYDTRGAGKSYQPDKPFSNTEDLYALLRYLKVDKASLAGISRGGGIAFDFTLMHPEMVEKLILVSANLSNLPKAYADMFAVATKAGKEQGSAEGAAVWLNDPYQGPRRDLVEARKRVQQVLEENISTFLHFAPGSAAVQQLQSSTVPTAQRLSDIHVPTFVIYGENDNVDARANYENWAKGIHEAKKLILLNAAHLNNIDQAKQFNQAVLEFLK